MSFLKKLTDEAGKFAKDAAKKAEDAIKANGGEKILNDAKGAFDKTVADVKKAAEQAAPVLDQVAEGLEKAAKTVDAVDAKIEEAVEAGKKKAAETISKYKPK